MADIQVVGVNRYLPIIEPLMCHLNQLIIGVNVECVLFLVVGVMYDVHIVYESLSLSLELA